MFDVFMTFYKNTIYLSKILKKKIHHNVDNQMETVNTIGTYLKKNCNNCLAYFSSMKINLIF